MVVGQTWTPLSTILFGGGLVWIMSLVIHEILFSPLRKVPTVQATRRRGFHLYGCHTSDGRDKSIGQQSFVSINNVVLSFD